MISAVDTNVLLDLLIPGAPHGDSAERALADSARAGALVICEIVYAEVAAQFSDRQALDHFLADTNLRLEPTSRAALHRAGRAWADYARRRSRGLACPVCGATVEPTCPSCRAVLGTRQHVLADFLIGAHATVHADRLLTRDRGYYARHFPELRLL